jgi:hypothetical protein
MLARSGRLIHVLSRSIIGEDDPFALVTPATVSNLDKGVQKGTVESTW